nr:arabinan endo-1,5-alpha-L-arabinosidase [uncultured Flavobacterium sp.]
MKNTKSIACILLFGMLIGSCQNEEANTASSDINKTSTGTVANTKSLTAKTVTGTVASHDPSTIVKSGVNYYVFTTGDNIPMTYSTNLVNWSWGTSVFTSTPSWIASYVPGFTKNFWAPDVAWFNNRWNMYYSCSTFGSATSAIGLVTAPSISQSAGTKWTDRGRVVSSTSSSDVNAIDPSILVDGSNVYMAYGSWHAGIGVVQITPSTGLPTGTRTIVAGGSAASWEAPCLIKEGSYYYMFVNRGNCCQGVNSTYYIVVGRSTSPFGPFVDKSGVKLTSGGGTTVLAKQGNYIGPGHLSRITGTQKGSVHYYDGADSGNPKLEIVYFTWSNGWPTLSY